MSVKKRLNDLNITLPNPSSPAANYVPYSVVGNQIFIAGQVPVVNGSVEGNTGKLGENVSIEEGKRIARICGLNIISQVSAANKGNLENVRCIKLGVFVNATDDFKDHPEVANGASDLMVEIFDQKGKHARASVGVSSLPRGVAVEVDAIFVIE